MEQTPDPSMFQPSFAQLRLSDLPPDPRWDRRRAVARSLRTLIDEVMTSAAPDSDFEALEQALDQHAARLADFEHHRGLRSHVVATGAENVARVVEVTNETNPVRGQSNPLAPPLRSWQDGDLARGEVHFGWPYEGPPGCVHGGFIAAAFDQFLGFVQCLADRAGMTGKLEISYHRPTPIDTPLRLEGEIESIRERRIHVVARMYAGETLTARARALFVEVPPGHLDRMDPGQPAR